MTRQSPSPSAFASPFLGSQTGPPKPSSSLGRIFSQLEAMGPRGPNRPWGGLGQLSGRSRRVLGGSGAVGDTTLVFVFSFFSGKPGFGFLKIKLSTIGRPELELDRLDLHVEDTHTQPFSGICLVVR